MKIDGYKCPNCAGTVSFDSDVQKMKCPFCDSEFEIAALEELQKEIEDYGQDSAFNWGGMDDLGEGSETISEADELATGSCPACGAELYGDQNTIATVCPCCGNAQIVAKRLDGVLKPHYVIPFKLKKDAAIEELKKFCKGKPLLPKDYLEEKRVNGMQGIYVPFWLFDTHARGHVRYKATKKKTWSDSNYRYIRTDYYSVVRDGEMDFEKIPVDASVKMDDAYMDAIEPFDYSLKLDFHQSYLAGYLAEKFDVSSDDSKKRAEKRIKGTIETEFRKTVTGYLTVTTESASVAVKEAKVQYSLFPVWVFNTKYNEENYQFMMNGQTGRLVGKLPVDKRKAWGFGSLFTALFGTILMLLSMFAIQPFLSEAMLDTVAPFPMSHVVTGIVVAWLAGGGSAWFLINSWIQKMNNAREQTNATEYLVQGSLQYRNKSDRFMYSRTTRIPRAKPSGNSRR